MQGSPQVTWWQLATGHWLISSMLCLRSWCLHLGSPQCASCIGGEPCPMECAAWLLAVPPQLKGVFQLCGARRHCWSILHSPAAPSELCISPSRPPFWARRKPSRLRRPSEPVGFCRIKRELFRTFSHCGENCVFGTFKTCSCYCITLRNGTGSFWFLINKPFDLRPCDFEFRHAIATVSKGGRMRISKNPPS